MNRHTLHCLACMWFLVLACVSLPAIGQVVEEYEYQLDRVYQVRTGLGLTTQIELSPSETIHDFSTGFSSGWDLSRRDNVFYLKPRNIDVDTNLLVRTATHSYIFELKVVATDWTALDQAKQAGVQYKIRFRYPNNTDFGAQADTSPGSSTVLDMRRSYNFSYDYSARNALAWLIPINVYDDGQFTYLRMGDLKELPTGNFPAVFGRDRERGEDFVVNTTVENNTIIVHGTYPYLVVRHGGNVVGLRRNTPQ